MTHSRHCCLADIIGFTKVSPPFIHLGVPIFIGKPKACHFISIADNIRLKVAAWKEKFLSMAGRVQLVKYVIFSMMVHCISVYNWSGSIIKMVDCWMKNFIWSGSIDKKNIVIVAWKTCYKKLNEGDLGIIFLKAYNSATNLQLCWKFSNKNQGWSKILNDMVKRNSRLINYLIKSSI